MSVSYDSQDITITGLELDILFYTACSCVWVSPPLPRVDDAENTKALEREIWCCLPWLPENMMYINVCRCMHIYTYTLNQTGPVPYGCIFSRNKNYDDSALSAHLLRTHPCGSSTQTSQLELSGASIWWAELSWRSANLFDALCWAELSYMVELRWCQLFGFQFSLTSL